MQTRREILRTGVGVAAAGGIAGLAGCSSVPVVGSYFDDGLDYTQWAYDPSELDATSIWTNLRHLPTLLEADEVEGKGDIRDSATNNYGGELLADDIDYVLSVGGLFNPAEVLVGSFDGDEVVDGMEFAPEDGYGEFDVYADGDDALVATDGDYLIRSAPGNYEYDAREEIELLIDTYNGDADGFVDVNDDFERVCDEAGTDTLATAFGYTESSAEDADDDETVAIASSGEIDGDEVNRKTVRLYRSEDGIDLDEIEAEIESEELEEGGELNDISQDGRMVTVELTVPTDTQEF